MEKIVPAIEMEIKDALKELAGIKALTPFSVATKFNVKMSVSQRHASDTGEEKSSRAGCKRQRKSKYTS
jgi:ribosomal protein S25